MLNETDRRRGTRHIVSIPVRLEWNDEKGMHVVADGNTENIGPRGTLVHLPRNLPNVGSQVRIIVLEVETTKNIRFEAEVLRLERNVARPLAALNLTEAVDEWYEKIWEVAAPKIIAAEAERANEFID